MCVCFFFSLYARRTCHSLHWCNCLTPCCLPDAMLSSDSRMMGKELQAEELEHMHIIQWFKVHVYTWTKQQSCFESDCIMYAFPTVCFNCNISSSLNLFFNVISICGTHGVTFKWKSIWNISTSLVLALGSSQRSNPCSKHLEKLPFLFDSILCIASF